MAAIDWLKALTMAVRVDRPGQQRTDFHTISDLPDAYLRFRGMTKKELSVIPVGTELVNGKANRWASSTMITKRDYLHDAAFTWLTTGPDESIDRLHDALVKPVWQIGMGRKSCQPTGPFVLGIHPGGLELAAGDVPSLALPERRAKHDTTEQARPEPILLDLVTVHGEAPAGHRPGASVQDRPIGAHPQQGYTTSQHLISKVAAPVVRDWTDLLGYSSASLTRPSHTSAIANADNIDDMENNR